MRHRADHGWSAYVNLGPLGDTPVALAIASARRRTLVILYFMHVRWSSKLTWVFAFTGFVFLLILIGFTLSDFWTRPWLELYWAE